MPAIRTIMLMLGTLLGVLIARFGVEPFILRGYQMYYRANISRSMLTVVPTLIVIGVGTLLSVCAVWFACRRLLKMPAVALLQASTPKGRTKASGKRSPLPLYSRLILRNIHSDLRRVIVTVVSVAGCCALVVVGFTLRHAVNGAVAAGNGGDIAWMEEATRWLKDAARCRLETRDAHREQQRDVAVPCTRFWLGWKLGKA